MLVLPDSFKKTQIIQLAQPRIPLQHLDLDEIFSITDCSMIKLAENKFHCEHLIYKGSRITEETLIQFEKHDIPLDTTGCITRTNQ